MTIIEKYIIVSVVLFILTEWKKYLFIDDLSPDSIFQASL